ncbi:MAG: methyltransferase [Myxococcota bacterium]|nr:methyltransferase [Myxococcota bacterium]
MKTRAYFAPVNAAEWRGMPPCDRCSIHRVGGGSMMSGGERASGMGLIVHADETVNAFGQDRWIIAHRAGFRPCPWAYQVAKFCELRAGDKIADLGCGAGALMIAVHALCPDVGQLVGVEYDERYADQSRRNLILNEIVQGTVLRADIRSIPLRTEYDVVVTNPPFYPPNWGRQSTNLSRARATHALHGDIVDFVGAAQHCLTPHGQLVVIYDSHRLTELMLACARWGMIVRKLRFLDDDKQRPSRVLLNAVRQGVGVVVDRRSFEVQGDLQWLT